VRIYNATERAWVPFELWPAQRGVVTTLQEKRKVIILKARQLGLSWVVLGEGLWGVLFHPIQTLMLLSRRDEEAKELLNERLKKMHAELPAWLQQAVRTDNEHEWELGNGSRALAFPTTGARSYTGSKVVVDEADFVEDLGGLLNTVEPTIDDGGQLILISTVDKDQPLSPFKRVYQAAVEGENSYHPIFLSWRARPGRTDEWYEGKRRDSIAKTGAEDDLHQEYPETDAQALAPNSQDKRIPRAFLTQCYREMKPLDLSKRLDLKRQPPAITGLEIYRLPEPGAEYVAGADPAEGNPGSDDSAITVLDRKTGEEVAALAGKFEPTVFGMHINSVCRFFKGAGVLVERNNHGHSVLTTLDEHGTIPILEGPDKKPGWNSNKATKVIMYDTAVEDFSKEGTILHSKATYLQLASIDGAKQEAPEGMMDDRATSYALALVARTLVRPPQKPYVGPPRQQAQGFR
jgi:hypothetical protein